MQRSDLGHGGRTANHRQVAFVEIMKRRDCDATQSRRNQFGNIRALLHRHLGDARQRFAIPVKRCSVTNDEDVRMARHGQITLHADSAGAVGGCSEPFAGW